MCQCKGGVIWTLKTAQGLEGHLPLSVSSSPTGWEVIFCSLWSPGGEKRLFGGTEVTDELTDEWTQKSITAQKRHRLLEVLGSYRLFLGRTSHGSWSVSLNRTGRSRQSSGKRNPSGVWFEGQTPTTVTDVIQLQKETSAALLG